MSAPGGRIVEVAALDLAYAPAPWPFARERAAAIAANWADRLAALPGLFDGRVLLAGSHAYVAREGATALRAAFFETDYKSFLAWRDFGYPDRNVSNCFSMAALQGADGGFLLGEMAAHTSSAGAAYFPAGTPDHSDIFGDRVDLAASARRELLEETGIAPGEVVEAPGWTIVDAPPRIACMKVMRMTEPAQRIQARVDRFLAADPDAELRRMHVVRAMSDLEGIRCPDFMKDFLRHALAA
ncbi:MAG: NUDIX hydrolase [Roseiarcus sp.]